MQSHVFTPPPKDVCFVSCRFSLHQPVWSKERKIHPQANCNLDKQTMHSRSAISSYSFECPFGSDGSNLCRVAGGDVSQGLVNTATQWRSMAAQRVALTVFGLECKDDAPEHVASAQLHSSSECHWQLRAAPMWEFMFPERKAEQSLRRLASRRGNHAIIKEEHAQTCGMEAERGNRHGRGSRKPSPIASHCCTSRPSRVHDGKNCRPLAANS